VNPEESLVLLEGSALVAGTVQELNIQEPESDRQEARHDHQDHDLCPELQKIPPGDWKRPVSVSRENDSSAHHAEKQ
jgi:hypothetical protein